MKSDNSTAYVCEGSCQAKISLEQYNKGLVKCGTKSCSMYGKPFKKVKS